MYSIYLPTKRSGNWLGAHQKFDRVAYRLLAGHINMHKFPTLKQILHFEGYNGPDGLPVKSPGKDEPRHYYNPASGEGPVLEYLQLHYAELVKALKNNDSVRAAFEASWLAHALTDGMTPAHHFPYVETVHHLHEQAHHTVEKVSDKLLIKGESNRETIRNTWQYLGGKGMLATHMHFEAGVAATISAYRFGNLFLNSYQINEARQLGYLRFFQRQARMIGSLKLYNRFAKRGWTIGLARQIKHVLAPMIIEAIATVWLLAYEEAHATT